MDISSALRVLRDTPLEILQHHTDDALSTLRTVEHRLKDLLHHKESETRALRTCNTCKRAFMSPVEDKHGTSKPTDLSGLTESSERSSAGVQPGIDDSAGNARKRKSRSNVDGTTITAPARPTALLKALIKAIPETRDLMKSEPINVIYKKRTHQEDRRLDDILRVEGNRQASNEDRLFRGLAQRSLAIQYSQFQRRSGQYPRVDELCDDISSQNSAEQKGDLHKRRGGSISQWARRHLTFAGGEINTAARCIHAGIKQLVMEKLLQQRLQQTSQSINASGISAFTALTVHNFKSLRLKEIPSFLDDISAESSIVSLPLEMPSRTVQLHNTSSRHILDIIGEVSEWFERFQLSYDDCSASNDQFQESQPAPPKSVCLAPFNVQGDKPTDTAEAVERAREELPGNERASTEERDSRGRSEPGQTQLGVDAADTVDGADYQEVFQDFDDDPASNHLISPANGQNSGFNRANSTDTTIDSSPNSHASFEVSATCNPQSNIRRASILPISDRPNHLSHNEPCAIEHTGCMTTQDISANGRYSGSQSRAESQEESEARRKRRRTHYHSGISTTPQRIEATTMGSPSNRADLLGPLSRLDDELSLSPRYISDATEILDSRIGSSADNDTRNYESQSPGSRTDETGQIADPISTPIVANQHNNSPLTTGPDNIRLTVAGPDNAQARQEEGFCVSEPRLPEAHSHVQDAAVFPDITCSAVAGDRTIIDTTAFMGSPHSVTMPGGQSDTNIFDPMAFAEFPNPATLLDGQCNLNILDPIALAEFPNATMPGEQQSVNIFEPVTFAEFPNSPPMPVGQHSLNTFDPMVVAEFPNSSPMPSGILDHMALAERPNATMPGEQQSVNIFEPVTFAEFPNSPPMPVGQHGLNTFDPMVVAEFPHSSPMPSGILDPIALAGVPNAIMPDEQYSVDTFDPVAFAEFSNSATMHDGQPGMDCLGFLTSAEPHEAMQQDVLVCAC